MSEWVDRIRNGDRRALARLITHIENDREGIDTVLADLFSYTGQAHIVGITGAPGTGKSTLVTQLTLAYRKRDLRVAILAIDPTSPFTGGAILGDRIRMQELSGDMGVFVRSMATRGSLGGLALASRDVIQVMDAAGFDKIIVETVGAGQNEVDIVRAAQTTVVVDAPGMGDGIQAIKAGILEIADVLVVNKADHPGSLNTVRALRQMIELGHPSKTYSGHHGIGDMSANESENVVARTETLWVPPIVETIASAPSGIDKLVDAIERHHNYLIEANLLRQIQRESIKDELFDRLGKVLLRQFLNDVPETLLVRLMNQIVARETSPRQAVDELLSSHKCSSI